jgi:cytochrome oxidase Cu insertion factor (SCO1/SenC/PrrC family)
VPAAALLVLSAALCPALSSMAATDPGLPAPPNMQFVPTPAGSYVLQRIQPSSDGVLLDTSAHPRSLSAFTHGKITLLTFFYTYCTDPWGCPFAFELMTGLRERIVADADLQPNVRFVSISFDPTHDSPAQVRNYASGLSGHWPFEWQFLTAASMAQLQPVLDGFGQDVRVEVDDQGRALRAINHMLKLFLIDANGTVREIYALEFLQPEVIWNDIRTLRLEARGLARRPLAH